MDIKLNEVNWSNTLLLNAMRSVSAAIVWVFIALAMGEENPESMLALPLIYPFLAAIGMFAISLHRAGVWWAIFFNWLAAIAILPGDPPIFFLNLFAPQLVPCEDYNFFNGLIVLVPK